MQVKSDEIVLDFDRHDTPKLEFKFNSSEVVTTNLPSGIKSRQRLWISQVFQRRQPEQLNKKKHEVRHEEFYLISPSRLKESSVILRGSRELPITDYL
jgi:hypothetical protein